MFRKFLLSAVVVLLLSSGALAGIGQLQGYSIGAVNLVERAGLLGSAEGGNSVMVSHGQEIYKPGTNSHAIQEGTGILIQSAVTEGIGGLSGVAQGASVQSLQGQLTGPFGSTAQGQCLNLGLEQLAIKTGGIGAAVGAQGFVGSQTQIIATPSMVSAESQFVGATQYSAVAGGPLSNSVVDNVLQVKLGQGQIAMGGRTSQGPE